MAKETLSVLFFLFTTASALECYNYTMMSCGEHAVQYDVLCDTFAGQSTGNEDSKNTCGKDLNKCAYGAMSYSIREAGNLKVNFKFAMCVTASENGCWKDVEDIAANLGTSGVSLQSGLAESGLTINSTDFCVCEDDRCNSALLSVCHITILMFAVLLALFM